MRRRPCPRLLRRVRRRLRLFAAQTLRRRHLLLHLAQQRIVVIAWIGWPHRRQLLGARRRERIHLAWFCDDRHRALATIAALVLWAHLLDAVGRHGQFLLEDSALLDDHLLHIPTWIAH